MKMRGILRVRPTGKYYIGSTSSYWKGRILRHVTAIRTACKYYIEHKTLDQILINGIPTKAIERNSLIRHLVDEHFIPNRWRNGCYVPHVAEIHELLEHKILWKGNALELGPRYGTTRCILCAKEEFYIREYNRTYPDKVVNMNEIPQACVHKA